MKGGAKRTRFHPPRTENLIKMNGPEIIARSISASAIPDKYGNTWQYHSRSDRHSKIACWVIAFELMQECSLLREHVSEKKVVLGVNYELRDFQTRRKKRLDLVIAKPENGDSDPSDRTFAEIGDDLGVVLDDDERAGLANLPSVSEGQIGSVLAALEAKACMTAHVRALPRLHDELDSVTQPPMETRSGHLRSASSWSTLLRPSSARIATSTICPRPSPW